MNELKRMETKILFVVNVDSDHTKSYFEWQAQVAIVS
jgi:hypothetical protein